MKKLSFGGITTSTFTLNGKAGLRVVHSVGEQKDSCRFDLTIEAQKLLGILEGGTLSVEAIDGGIYLINTKVDERFAASSTLEVSTKGYFNSINWYRNLEKLRPNWFNVQASEDGIKTVTFELRPDEAEGGFQLGEIIPYNSSTIDDQPNTTPEPEVEKKEEAAWSL